MICENEHHNYLEHVEKKQVLMMDPQGVSTVANVVLLMGHLKHLTALT